MFVQMIEQPKERSLLVMNDLHKSLKLTLKRFQPVPDFQMAVLGRPVSETLACLHLLIEQSNNIVCNLES